ncbi:zinc-finger of nitric oxide synthase-interacting protein [Hirsutella rhossiliensis]|uniref:Zinc-finger of nitric oxide synthase-interacting protein n=1 Tax=Hirsutella rhossiliensis TaxID=111463 RepID=A0A9P8MSU6_9HYPO|nr:zinc-finger of nitric oxide synthase-interacting protein [Hirsutella rhossiliensis]KAH0960534.1 zinc-finger of nitric oxide synthase-interacting protein [Hirsutella rhossiliensis]
MAHSKRNTSRAVFTSHERALAKSDWATSSARLNRDSFLPFGSCGLCLGIAREPVACLRGDVFCRECALANILAQKKEMKRADKARRGAKQEAEQARAMEDEEDRDRAIRDFELTQAGLSSAKKRSKSTPKPTPTPITRDKPSNALVLAGSKRKFALDEDEVSRIAQEDKTRARKAIEEEKAAKPTLPSFWTPSLTPDVQDSKLPPASRKDKSIPICPSSPADDLHPISMQSLVTVHFNEDVGQSSETKLRTCPSCLKALSNSSKPVMAEQCGHVLCMSCVKLLMQPAEKSTPQSEAPITCYVCDAPVVSKKSSKRAGPKGSLPFGLVALRSEGTGFSARGSNTVEKSSIAFQC